MKKEFVLNLLIISFLSIMISGYFMFSSFQNTSQENSVLPLTRSKSTFYGQIQTLKQIKNQQEFREFQKTISPTFFLLALGKYKNQVLWDKYHGYVINEKPLGLETLDNPKQFFSLFFESIQSKKIVATIDNMNLDYNIYFSTNSLKEIGNICSAYEKTNSIDYKDCMDNVYFFRSTTLSDCKRNIINEELQQFCESYFSDLVVK